MKNVILIALGGHGTKLAVSISEDINKKTEGTPDNPSMNCRLFAIDIGPGLNIGFPLDRKSFFPIALPGTDLNLCWKNFLKTKSSTELAEEPWMRVGPISESELWLARDAQQSGVRRVDYNLLLYLAKDRLHSEIREALSELSLNANDSNSGITVVIFGSLAGRTSSISYSPLLKMLESLRSEFKLEPSYSFLFTPEAFHKAYQRRCSEEGCEHVFNFLGTTSEVERYFREIDGAFKPTQFLVDKLCACLEEYTEDLCECEIIKKIVGLINLDPQTVSYDDELEIWVSKFGFIYSRAIEYVFSIQMLGLFKRLFSDLTIQTESLNPINVSYNDLFANLDRSKADPVVIVPKVVLPSTPASVSIKAEGKKAIRINWTAPKTSGTGKVLNYEIYRNGKKIATVSASARTLLDRNLDSRQSYTYRIVTVGSQGKSIKSPYTRAILPGSWAYRLVLYLRKR